MNYSLAVILRFTKWPLELPQTTHAAVGLAVDAGVVGGTAGPHVETSRGEAPNTRLPVGIVFLLATSPGRGVVCIESFPCLDVVHEQRGDCF